METTEAVELFGALAQETRVEVFRYLVRRAPRGAAAGEIADELGVAAATLSFHLKELKINGLVSCQREGRSLIYAPNLDRLASLSDFLLKNCCEGGSACAPLADAQPTDAPAPKRRRSSGA